MSNIMCKIGYRTYTVESVANRIVELAKEVGIKDITNLKLQKLVYFVQGFALAKLEYPLFKNEIQAWTYGPVVPELYQQLKKYGDEVITDVLQTDIRIESGSEEDKVIREVIEKIGDMTAMELTYLSHKKGSPWDAAWRIAKYSSIDLWQMVFYFTKMLKPKTPVMA